MPFKERTVWSLYLLCDGDGEEEMCAECTAENQRSHLGGVKY